MSIGNETRLLQLMESSNVVSGDFQAIRGSNVLMDLDLKNVRLKNCTILGADFCSSVFKNCTFDNVLLKDSALVGVTFDDCNFIECKFSNIQSGFNIKNCNVDGLTITQEFF